MPVISINIGPKRVSLTAFCPDDELGLMACMFVLDKVKQLLGTVSDDEFRTHMVAKDPEYAELFKLLDSGWRLPKTADKYAIDPSNPVAELRIVGHLMSEQQEQCGKR